MVDDYRRLITFTKHDLGKAFEYGWPGSGTPGSSRTPGAFRAISVRALREDDEIHLYEWPQLRYHTRVGGSARNYPRYAALSHVWKMGSEVTSEMKQGRTLKIKTNRPRNGAPPGPGEYDKPDKVFSDGFGRQDIGWQALKDAVDAAHKVGSRYVWLDLLCMDEVDGKDKEKELQISNMANIYTFAHQVIILVGGMGAVQDVHVRSGWMDRAWTLEEATVCRGKTCVLVHWPYKKDFSIPLAGASQPLQVNFQVPANHVKTSLIPLRTLLALPRDLASANPNPPLNLPAGFRIRCLDGCAGPRVGTTARTALLHYFSFNNNNSKNRRGSKTTAQQTGRDAAIFRSMLLRTSVTANDVVYSVQGIFNLYIDPHRSNRTVQELFDDLARKMANRGRPAWLSMGSVTGSAIPRHGRTLIPRVPEFPKEQNETPYYRGKNGRRIPSGRLVDDGNGYIGSYTIRFKTFSLPHVVCTHLLFFPRNIRPIRRRRDGKRTFKTRETNPRTCVFQRGWSRLAIEVGTVSSWPGSVRNPYTGWVSIIFLRWVRGGWMVVGDGVISPPPRRGRHGRNDRHHLAIGNGTRMKQRRGYWKCDCGGPPRTTTTTTKTLGLSYGIIPLKQPGGPPGLNPILWVGRKGDRVRVGAGPTLYKLSYAFPYFREAEQIGLRFDKGYLALFMYNSRNTPRYVNEIPDRLMRVSAVIQLMYSDVEFVEAGGGGGGEQVVTYSAGVEWRRDMMYLTMRKTGNRKRGERHIAPAPYRIQEVYGPGYPWTLP